MADQSILVVDDEPDIRELLHFNLQASGFLVLEAESGEMGLDMAIRYKPDLILLDLMLPHLSGLDVCREIRRNPALDSIIIIMLTARGEEGDVVLGFELGANDYITKPFSIKVLLARVRAALRNKLKPCLSTNSSLVSVHGLLIDMDRHTVSMEGKTLDLSLTEFMILHLLASMPGVVFTRERIISGVKGEDYPVTERSVDVHVLSLRRKLGEKGNILETVRGRGYRMKDLL